MSEKRPFGLDERTYDVFSLHFIVIIFGFTGILGGFSELPALQLVLLRVGVAVVSLAVWTKGQVRLPPRAGIQIIATGVIIALHWIAFFWAIQVSTVSLTLLCLTIAPFFASLLEPLIHRRRFELTEALLGLASLAAFGLLYRDAAFNLEGVAIGLGSAFFAALFGVINGLWVRNHSALTVGYAEQLGAFIFLVILFLALPDFTGKPLMPVPTFDANAWLGISWQWPIVLTLGTLATAYAFVVSVRVLRTVTPYTAALTINLEPVYGVIAAALIFGEKEKMSPLFYVVMAVALTTVLLNAWLKKRSKKRLLRNI